MSLLANRVSTKGILSLTSRNRQSLALRPGLRGQWREAIAAFDGKTYVNELGAHARADDLESVVNHLNGTGLGVVEWFGGRLFQRGHSTRRANAS